MVRANELDAPAEAGLFEQLLRRFFWEMEDRVLLIAKNVVKAGDIIVTPPGVPHLMREVNDHIVFMNLVFGEQSTGRKLTTGYTIQVAIDVATREMCYVCPQVLWDRLGVSA